MTVKTEYISKVGRDYKVSPHFKLGEIASRDGADKVLYDTELLSFFEMVRELLGGDGRATVGVNSWYRSPAHNRAVGGASKSTHTEGIAADVVFKQDGKRVPAKLICCLLQDLGIGGIAYINAYTVHVDNRKNGRYRGYEPDGFGNNVGGDFYKFFNVKKSQVEALKVKKEVPKEEEEEMIYKDITEVPEWGREAVQLRLDHGWTDGKNLTESMVRCWVVEDRENPYIADIGDVPTWAVPEVQALIDAGKIKGNGVEQIGKRWQVIESVIIGNR